MYATWIVVTRNFLPSADSISNLFHKGPLDAETNFKADCCESLSG